MILPGIAHMTPCVSVLSQDQIFEIHRAALDVLEKTGNRILNAKVRDLPARAGAKLEGDIVKAPEGLVMDCLAKGPGGFSLYDPTGNRALEVEGKRVYFSSSWASPNTRDALTGQVHPTLVEDIRREAIIADALPNIDFVTSMGSCRDVPVICADI